MNDSKSVKDSKGAQFRAGYLCAVLALVLAVCALGCVSVVYSCEKDARYLSASVTTSIFALGIALASLFSLVALFIFEKDRVDLAKSSGAYAKVMKYANLLPALLSFYITFFALFDESFGEWGNAVMLFGVVAAIFFIFKTFFRSVVFSVISGFGVLALCTVIVVSLYFDLKIELNSHFKLLVQFGAAGMMLGTIADLRALLSSKESLGSEADDRELIKIGTRGFVSLKSLSFTLCSVCSSVIVIYFIEGNAALGSHYLAYSILYLAYSILSALELIGAVTSTVKSHI